MHFINIQIHAPIENSNKIFNIIISIVIKSYHQIAENKDRSNHDYCIKSHHHSLFHVSHRSLNVRNHKRKRNTVHNISESNWATN